MPKTKKQEKLKSIIRLDVREDKNRQKLVKALLKTKWLKKFDLDAIESTKLLEKLYRKVIKKYPGHISYVMSDGENQTWALMVKNSDTGEWIFTVYAVTLWEGLAKVLLVLYGYHILGYKFRNEA